MEVFSCENRLDVKSLRFSSITFMILPFWIIVAWKIYLRFI